MSFTINQFVYNIPASRLFISGESFIPNDNGEICQCGLLTIYLVVNANLADFLILDSSSIILNLHLICPNVDYGGSFEYDTSQFFTVNSDHPIVGQVLPGVESLPASITLRLPAQKVIKVRPLSVHFYKCIDYFTCPDYILEIRFPRVCITDQLNFTLEFITTQSESNKSLCGSLQIVKNNCDQMCLSEITINHHRVFLQNNITLTCQQKIICFCEYNRLQTVNGWKLVKNVQVGDVLLTLEPKNKTVKVSRIYQLPIFNVIRFIQFPANCFEPNMPSQMCFLTPEHMIKTKLGNFNADYYQKTYELSHNIQSVQLYAEHIYAFEVETTQKDIFVDYEGLPSRVWSLNERENLKSELAHLAKKMVRNVKNLNLSLNRPLSTPILKPTTVAINHSQHQTKPTDQATATSISCSDMLPVNICLTPNPKNNN